MLAWVGKEGGRSFDGFFCQVILSFWCSMIQFIPPPCGSVLGQCWRLGVVRFSFTNVDIAVLYRLETGVHGQTCCVGLYCM
jgi:hypothetical protein